VKSASASSMRGGTEGGYNQRFSSTYPPYC
jgi:hypothetical protein